MTFADFREKLTQEQQDTLCDETRELLKQLYPGARGYEPVKDLWRQKHGTDVLIKFDGQRPRIVDLKFRSAEQDYEDFCLEFSHTHDDGRETPGWVADDAKTNDDIVYIRKKRWLAFVLPRERTQLAWHAYGSQWQRSFIVKRTRNITYWTNWCAVPVEVLEQAVGPIRGAYL